MKEKEWTIKESDVYSGIADGMGCAMYFFIPVAGLILLSMIGNINNDRQKGKLEKVLQGKEIVLEDLNKDGRTDMIFKNKEDYGILLQDVNGNFTEVPYRDWQKYIDSYVADNLHKK